MSMVSSHLSLIILDVILWSWFQGPVIYSSLPLERPSHSSSKQRSFKRVVFHQGGGGGEEEYEIVGRLKMYVHYCCTLFDFVLITEDTVKLKQ